MEHIPAVALVVSILSLTLNVVLWVTVHRIRTSSAQAQIELMVAAQVMAGRQKHLERLEKQLEAAAGTSSEMDALQATLVRETAAAYCNALEVLCSLYLDNKVDKERIRKSYSLTIFGIVKDKNFIEFYREPGSRFQATLKVFKQWSPNKE
jgi:hypothetical protein